VSDKPFPVIAVSINPDGKTALLSTVFTPWLSEMKKLEPRRDSDSAALKTFVKINFENLVIRGREENFDLEY